MATILFGIAYLGILFGIAVYLMPIAYIPFVYAIAGLTAILLKQVSLAVEKCRRLRYNVSMGNRPMATLGLAEAYRAVEAGASLYIVAQREPFPNALQGAWLDAEGRLYLDPVLITPDRAYACAVGLRERQECILHLQGTPDGAGWLYLLQDTPSNRGYALTSAGGYTADGEHLLVYSPKPLYGSLIDGGYSRTLVKAEFPTPVALIGGDTVSIAENTLIIGTLHIPLNSNGYGEWQVLCTLNAPCLHRRYGTEYPLQGILDCIPAIPIRVHPYFGLATDGSMLIYRLGEDTGYLIRPNT